MCFNYKQFRTWTYIVFHILRDSQMIRRVCGITLILPLHELELNYAIDGRWKPFEGGIGAQISYKYPISPFNGI